MTQQQSNQARTADQRHWLSGHVRGQCCVGTTFAWFTDTASTGVNKIQAGNLDVKLMYSTDMVEWKEATDQTKLFDDNALWEPGYTQVVYLKVVNAGNLALKYEAGFSKNYTSNRGKNVNGDWYRVDNYLKIGTAETTTKFANREDVWSAIAATEKTLAKDVMLTDGLDHAESQEKSPSPSPWRSTCPPRSATKPMLQGSNLPLSPASALRCALLRRLWKATALITNYDANAATVLKRVEYTDGEHTVTGNIQANGTAGAIHGTGTAKITVDATTVYGTYVSNYAMAVCASSRSEIIIKGGEFANQAPAGSALSLIYAEDNAKITIEGGTFKCVSPAWTLNCNDSDPATITVKGGSFYKFDPSNVTVGEGEIFIADGYKVVQNGDWYTVVPE